MHPKFQLNQQYFLGCHFSVAKKLKIPEDIRKTLTSNTL